MNEILAVLNINTQYDLQMKSWCSNGQHSNWSNNHFVSI